MSQDNEKTDIACEIILLLFTVFNLIVFVLLYINPSKKQSASLIPKLITLSCAFQLIADFSLMISINSKDFFDLNPLPKKIIYLLFMDGNNYTNIYQTFLKNLMKLINYYLFVLGMISLYTTEILYCIESLLLFLYPVSRTNARNVVYNILIFGGGIGVTLYDCIYNYKKQSGNDNNDITKKIQVFAENMFKLSYKIKMFSHFFIYLLILSIIYVIISIISFIFIYCKLNTKSILFQSEKKIFKARHIFYITIASILTILNIVFHYLGSNKVDITGFELKSDVEAYIIVMIPILIAGLGFSNCIIRMLEIDIFAQIKAKCSKKKLRVGVYEALGYNEKAVKQLNKILEEDQKLKDQGDTIFRNTISNNNQNNEIENKIRNKELRDLFDSDDEKISPKKLSLSAQIAFDYLSESVFYIISNITEIAKRIPEDEGEIRDIGINSNLNVVLYNFSYKEIESNLSNNNINNNDENINEENNNNCSNLLQKELYENQQYNNNNDDDDAKNYKKISWKQQENNNDVSDIQLYSYAKEMFRNIQRKDNITKDILKESFNIPANVLGLASMKVSEGKSGSFFFITANKKFIIKTISSSEKDALISLLPSYYEHMMSNNKSLLCKIYGLYTLKLNISELHVVLMENITPFEDSEIIYKFDLKGSSVGRKTKKFYQGFSEAMKDLDYLQMSIQDKNIKINFANDIIQTLGKTIDSDVSILKRANLMDYSLFISISRISDVVNPESLIDKDKFYISNVSESKMKKHELTKIKDVYKGKICYFVGIIDYLTDYGFMKKLENHVKGCGKKNISAIEPMKYAQRFMDFLTKKREDNGSEILLDYSRSKIQEIIEE